MFLKKLSLCSFLCVLALSLAFTFTALAQDKDPDTITVDDLNKEGPLTQRDIDVYLEYVGKSKDFMAKMQENPQYDIKGEWLKFAKDHQISSIRFNYVSEKIPFGLMAISAADPKSIPAPDAPFLKLSDEEKKLLTANRDKIIAAFEALKK
ncbi:MAG: hypothetical protein LBS60_04815 [Deltaproteobacteria bacterium]|jgi:hypothetical protein|nr:hypothetical protein [Deltaproteobacteria bacterium]